MKSFNLILSVAVFCCGVNSLLAQDPTMVSAMKKETSAFFKADAPGGSILVMKKGEVILKEAIGMADMELNVPIQPDMVFSIGSISKQFAAVAILKLQEEGKLSVDDIITKHLPDYPLNGKTITIRHLLNHTSGIRNYTDMPSFSPSVYGKDVTTSELIDFFKNEPLDFEPGTQWNYSNSGYVLLGAIVEKVTGKDYGDYVSEEFFKKLGMKNSYWGDMHKIIPNRTKGYAPNGEGGFVNATYLSMTWPHAAGSILSTPSDLYIWTKAINEYKVISKSSLGMAYTPAVLADGTVTDYGFGWGVTKIKGRKVIEHSGGINGYVSNEMYLPDEDVFVAITINQETNGGTELGSKLAAIAIGDPYVYPAFHVEEKVMKDYVGVYVNAKGNERMITQENGVLYSQRPGSVKYQLTPFAADKFVFYGALTEIHFNREKKKITGLDFSSRTSGDEHWTKTDKPIPVVKVVQVDEKILKSYVGEYELVPGFVMTITFDNGKLYGQPTNQPVSEFFATDNTHFFIKEVDAKFTFVVDKDGKATGLILDQGEAHMEGKRVK